jgi:NAD(P)-dependent dehydrogenase (short-subunit alcohol dehydrogenase family)
MQMTRWLATSLAPDIRVNSLAPGGVERDTPARFKQAYEARTPLRRMATEEDMKGAAVFLASDASAYVTGQCLTVDGGWSAW